MKKKDIRAATGISSSSMAKMSKGQLVSMEVLRKICLELDVGIEDVVEFVRGE